MKILSLCSIITSCSSFVDFWIFHVHVICCNCQIDWCRVTILCDIITVKHAVPSHMLLLKYRECCFIMHRFPKHPTPLELIWFVLFFGLFLCRLSIFSHFICFKYVFIFWIFAKLEGNNFIQELQTTHQHYVNLLWTNIFSDILHLYLAQNWSWNMWAQNIAYYLKWFK